MQVSRCRLLAAHGLTSCLSVRTQPLTATGAPSQTSTIPYQVMKGRQIQASGLDHLVGWPRSHVRVAVVPKGYVPVVHGLRKLSSTPGPNYDIANQHHTVQNNKNGTELNRTPFFVCPHPLCLCPCTPPDPNCALKVTTSTASQVWYGGMVWYGRCL